MKLHNSGVIYENGALRTAGAGDDVKAGDEAVIYGSGVNEMTVAEAAALASTNKNELLSRITRRPRKIYVDEKRE